MDWIKWVAGALALAALVVGVLIWLGGAVDDVGSDDPAAGDHE